MIQLIISDCLPESRQMEPDHRDQHHGLDRYGANLKSPGHAAERTAFHQDRKDDGRSPGGDPFQTHSAEY